MIFNNKPNTPVTLDNGSIVWISRSVAVNLALFVYKQNENVPYVLASKRGPKAADYHGYMNLVAGYLDWDESGKDAIIRETWEECGLNIKHLLSNSNIICNDLENPWYVQTDPSANRQNISLRYGLIIRLLDNELPKLSIKYNEIEGEVEDPQWIPIDNIVNYKWAFGHDKVIYQYQAIREKHIIAEFCRIKNI